MNKCLLCDYTTNRPKYCSKKCVKRAWYLRNNPKRKSYEKGGDFWNTETGIGFKWEKFIADKIGAEHLPFNNGGCDLRHGKEKIDVKACNLWKRNKKRGVPVKKEQAGVWVFNRNKMKKCNRFICICLIDNEVHKILDIPGVDFPKSGAVIGHKSKYDKYQVFL